ncbi:MAG: peptide/nickel transport system permease protein [Alphaproteobacteria bacterium]|jgi:peptide/nickel transport system permease protein|nr:peptide/nickel transport system permease protein [Alphaproteobacteria bacterium]
MLILTRASVIREGNVSVDSANDTPLRMQGRRLPCVALAIFGVFVFMAIFAEVLSPHSPYQTALSKRMLPPFWMEGGSIQHLLGTDRLGRDSLSRIIMGARVSLLAGFVAVAIAAAVGAVLGLLAGYLGRWVDAVIMRATDAALSFPLILIALLFAVALGPSFTNLILVLALVMWARFARLARGETLTWKERDFVALARVAGCSMTRILLRHIFPNVVNTLVVLATLQVGWVITVEAALSFLGAGVPPPNPSWGGLIAEGRNFVSTAWWLSFFPGLAIILLVMSINLIGDWLRDELDPKIRDSR